MRVKLVELLIIYVHMSKSVKMLNIISCYHITELCEIYIRN